MKPLWSEGLHVMPQHFQALDSHYEEELDGRLRALEPHAFGVTQLEIDEDALVRGVFQVRKLTALMPDGMRVTVGPDHPIKEAVLMVDGAIVGGGRKAEVYLGVPSDASRGTPGYAGDMSSAGARWVRVPRMLRDAYGGAEEAEVEQLRPNVQLLLGTSDRRSYITIKLAEVALAESGALVVSDDYIPPVMSIGASRGIAVRLSRLITAIGAKQQAIAQRYRGRSTALVEFGPVDMVTFWYLHTLNSSLPRLVHLEQLRRTHPERLYLALAELAASLSTFEPQRKPRDIPPYNHLALNETLFPLFEQVHALLATVIAQQYKTIALDQPQPGLFVARQLDTAMLKKSQLFLIASGEVPETSLRKELPTFIRISSLEQITNVVHAALPGLEAKVDLSPPTAIPVRAENVYLRLGQDGPHWKDIVRTASIAIFQPIKPKDVVLELVAVEL